MTGDIPSRSAALTGKAVLVAYAAHLEGMGGVQVCTREFRAALDLTGLNVSIVAVEPDLRFPARLRRRLAGSPYYRPISPAGIEAVRNAAVDADIILLNQVALAGALPLSPQIAAPVVALSHGCEVTDLLHLARLRYALPLSTNQLRPTAKTALSQTLADEMAARRHLDGVIAISPFDADCESWLGTRRITWISRTVHTEPLERNRVPGRFGFVGTLDHAPNLEGLVAVLEAIESSKLENLAVRIVGGPTRIGNWLQGKFRCVAYLGQLDDAQLRQEASSWNGFLHPIFNLPRGCSTKLAGALEWGLPIVTTPHGRRGYTWSGGAVVEVEDPSAFVSAMIALIQPQNDAEAAMAVRTAAASAPSIDEVAARIADFLAPILSQSANRVIPPRQMQPCAAA